MSPEGLRQEAQQIHKAIGILSDFSLKMQDRPGEYEHLSTVLDIVHLKIRDLARDEIELELQAQNIEDEDAGS